MGRGKKQKSVALSRGREAMRWTRSTSNGGQRRACKGDRNKVARDVSTPGPGSIWAKALSAQILTAGLEERLESTCLGPTNHESIQIPEV